MKNLYKEWQFNGNSGGHVDKSSNDYDVGKMIKEKNVSINHQLNLDEDLPTRNMLSTLAPNPNDIKVCDAINESIGNSSNRAKVNLRKFK